MVLLKIQAAIFQALADPTRLAIFERLACGECTVNELSRGFPVTQPAVSQHLAALSRCHLVTNRRQGRSAIYRVTPEGLAPLHDWLAHYREQWPEHLDRLKTLFEIKSKATTFETKGERP